jgi:signal transduction histidine kinase
LHGIGALADRDFMVLATATHCLITLLGVGHLVATFFEDPSFHLLLSPSLALFVLTGALAAVLLGHLGVTMDGGSEPRATCAEHRPAPARSIADKPAIRRCVLPVLPATHNTAESPQVAGHSRSEAALTALMGQISHEIRTPLNAIIGFSDLMQRELMGPLGSPRYREYARHIRESGLAVLRAAEETMMLAALVKEPHRSAIDVVDVDVAVETACRSASEGASARRIEIRSVTSSACRASADPRAMHQALSNLITAAVQRAPDGATVHVATRSSRLDILVKTNGNSAGSQPGSAQLSTCIGNALLELQGATVTTERLSDGDWRTSATFPPPVNEILRRSDLRQRIIRHRQASAHRLHA